MPRKKFSKILTLCSSAAILGSVLVGGAPPAGAGVVITTTRPVLGLASAQPNAEIINPSLTASRSFMVFQSDASNLVAGDTNGYTDIFVRNMTSGAVARVSLLPGGLEADADSYSPSISDDGEKVVFTTDSDLFDEENDFNSSADVYLVDRDADNDNVLDEWADPAAVRVARMSVGTDNLEADFGGIDGVISGNGSWVTYSTDSDLEPNDLNGGLVDVYARATDPAVDVNERISFRTNTNLGGGALPSISQTGRYVAFATTATDLVSGGSVGGIIVRDRDTDADGTFDEAAAVANEYASKSTTAPNGASGTPDLSRRPSISPNGTCVAFRFTNGFALAADAVANGIYLRNRTAATTVLVSKNTAGLAAIEAARPAVSPSCRYVTFDTGDTGFYVGKSFTNRSLFVRDVVTNKTELLSRNSPTSLVAAANGDTVSEQSFDDARALATTSATQIGTVSFGNGLRDPALIAYVLDFTAPTATMVSPSPTAATTRWTLATTVPVQWSGSDGFTGTGVKSYVVERQQALYNAALPLTYGSFLPTTTATTSSYVGGNAARGTTQCFRARATDNALNAGTFGTAGCTAIPLHQGQTGTGQPLVYSGAWTPTASVGSYLGSYRQTTTTGAFVQVANVQARRLALVVTRCPTCGSVSVTWTPTVGAAVNLGTISLVNAATLNKQVVNLGAAPFASVQTGTLKVTVNSTGGKPVRIEGIGITKSGL